MGHLRAIIFGGNGQSGYSLIGTAVMIVLIGMFTAAGVMIYQQYSWTQKNMATNEKLEIVKTALAQYKSIHGRLPCPARLDSAPTTAEFGVATDCSAPPVGDTFHTSGRNGWGIRYGAVPVRTLSIKENSAFDGWHHRIVYAVTEYYATGTPDDYANRGAIAIVDGGGNAATNEAGNVIYTLVAPGEDSRGAYSVAGIRIDNCDSAGHGENCNNDGTLLSNMIRQWGTGASEQTSKLNYVASTLAYDWTTTGWSGCDNETPNQTRTVTCVEKSSGSTVVDSFCATELRPDTTQACRGETWKYKEPPCPALSCGETVSVPKIAFCRQNDAVEIPDSQCQDKFGAAEVQYSSCSGPPCPPPPPPPVYYGGGGGGGGGGYSGFVDGVYVSCSSDSCTVGSSRNPDGSYYAPDPTQLQNFYNHNNGTGSNGYYGSANCNGGGCGGTGYSSGSSSSGSSSSGSSGGGGGGYSCMIVTHFYRRGLFGRAEWLVNKRDALSGRMRLTTLYGYHVWAPMAVSMMRKYPVVEKLFFKLFMARNRALCEYQGRGAKAGVLDHTARLLLEVPSAVIGFIGLRPDHDFNYGRIYGTEEDEALIESKYYVRQPQGMIGW